MDEHGRMDGGVHNNLHRFFKSMGINIVSIWQSTSNEYPHIYFGTDPKETNAILLNCKEKLDFSVAVRPYFFSCNKKNACKCWPTVFCMYIIY